MTDGRVALVTCREFPDLDDDDRLVIPELATLGHRGEPAVWDDEGVDWHVYDLVVVRSTWDYVDRRDEFLAWADAVPRLANPAEVLRWNTDKRYLRELAAAGVPVVPTEWIEPGDEVRLPARGRFVIKPAIGAGSRDAGRFDLADPGERGLADKHVRQLTDRGDTAMVQPYLHAVDSAGETAMLYLGGRFSHAIAKAALLSGPDTAVDGLYREEQVTPRTPSGAERELAEAVVDALPQRLGDPPLYARVDLVPDGAGEPVLLELELSEPSLFLSHGAGAPVRWAAAIGTHLDRVLRTS